jgi:small-conductance mechanosensitive channel
MVIRLTSRATVLLNQDGNQIRIPNAIVFKGLIVNFTRRPQRRFTFSLGIAPDEDLGRAQRVALEALARVDGVLADPPASALYKGVGESAVTMIVAGWMDQTTHDFLRVRSEAIRVVLTTMGAAHVDLPEPTLRLRRAPKPTAGVAETQPPIATGRDSTLNRAVQQERIRGQDGLAPGGREE